MAQTLAFTQCNPTEWVYQAPRRNDNGGYSVYVNVSRDVHKNPKIQLQKGRCPFGIQRRDDAAENSRSNLELSVESPEFSDFLNAVDQQNMNVLVENSEEVFTRRVPIETMDMFYRPLNKKPKADSNYDPLLRVKINSAPGDRQTKVSIVVSEKEGRIQVAPGSLSDVTPNCSVLAIVNVNGLWIVSGKSGMTLVATHLLVWPSDSDEDGFVGMELDVVDPNAAREHVAPDETVINASVSGGVGSVGSDNVDEGSLATEATEMED